MYIHTLSQNPETTEGDIATFDSLSLDLDDDQIATLIGNRVSQAEAWWNSTLNLNSVREENERYWLNQSFDDKSLYNFQVPYKDPRIFVSVESLIPMALSRAPQPVVTEANDSDASRELAHNLQDILLAKYEDLYLKQKFMMVARHLLIGLRLGVMKYSWDNTIGRIQEDGTRFGDVRVDVIRPQRIVVSEASENPDDVELVGEYQKNTVEALCYKFPNKKDEIWKETGGVKGMGSMQSKLVGNTEIWFCYYGTNNEKKEAVAWKLGHLLLGSMKNPHWNYDETETGEDGKVKYLNFFDKPKKPYIFFNFLNLGKYLIDDTSLTEQAKNLQDVLNKRGRQIVENADAANAGTIFNSEMISQAEVAKLLGNPREKIMVKGNVQAAATRLPSNQLEDYVVMDKQDARSAIDNIFSTHGAIRGETTKSKTLGQDVLSQRGDISRIQTLATSIEDGADRLYKGMVQMFKVFYDEPQMVKYTGSDGNTTFIEFSNMTIQDGIKVRVKSGSVLPEDPIAKQEQTLQALPILDPLTIGEGLGKENPKEFAKRIMLFRIAPEKYFTDILSEDPFTSNVDASAAQDIQLLNAGKEVPPQTSPTKQHLATHQAFMESPQYKQLPPEIQQLHSVHAKAEITNAKKELGQPVDENELVGSEDSPVAPQAEPTNGLMSGQTPQPQQGGLMQKAKEFLTQNI